MKEFMTALLIVVAIVLAFILGTYVEQEAHAAVPAPLVIGHRGASNPIIPESTRQAYEYAAPASGMLEADIAWTKDSDDADTVGTMVVFHDSTLDRTTSCTGQVADRLWTYIRDNCFTDINHQPVLKLTDLVAYARTVGKPLLFHMKVNMNSAQSRQFWKAAKIAPTGSLLAGSKSRVPGIQLVKKLDSADTGYRLRYGYETTGDPSATYVKSVGPYLVIEQDISKAQVAAYRAAGLVVYLWTGRTETEYASMNSKLPNGVIVDDAPRYARWLASR